MSGTDGYGRCVRSTCLQIFTQTALISFVGTVSAISMLGNSSLLENYGLWAHTSLVSGAALVGLSLTALAWKYIDSKQENLPEFYRAGWNNYAKLFLSPVPTLFTLASSAVSVGMYQNIVDDGGHVDHKSWVGVCLLSAFVGSLTVASLYKAKQSECFAAIKEKISACPSFLCFFSSKHSGYSVDSFQSFHSVRSGHLQGQIQGSIYGSFDYQVANLAAANSTDSVVVAPRSVTKKTKKIKKKTQAQFTYDMDQDPNHPLLCAEEKQDVGLCV